MLTVTVTVTVGTPTDGVVVLLILFEDGGTFCCNVALGFVFSAFGWPGFVEA